MSMVFEGKEINGGAIGGKVIFEDNGWIPLRLPSGVGGLILFKDNNDGTASLIGNVGYTYTGKPVPVIAPPEGYEFTDFNWNAGYSVNIRRGVCSINNLSGSLPQGGEVIQMLLSDGVVCAGNAAYSTSIGVKRTLIFTRSSTIEGSTDPSPALISIAKI